VFRDIDLTLELSIAAEPIAGLRSPWPDRSLVE
jgi:hypothetical protein